MELSMVFAALGLLFKATVDCKSEGNILGVKKWL